MNKPQKYFFRLVFAYSVDMHERGAELSRHSTYDLAFKAAKRSGYDSFLAIRAIDGLS